MASLFDRYKGLCGRCLTNPATSIHEIIPRSAGGDLIEENQIPLCAEFEIMLNAVNIALVAFSRYVTPQVLTGHIFAIFVMAVAAAEAAVGIAIIITIYRNRETISVDKFDLTKSVES